MSTKKSSAQAGFQWDDPFLLDEQLTDEERMVRDSARTYCQEKLMPRVRDSFRHEKFDREVMNEMGAMGFLGPTIEGYGCAGVNHVCYGLIAREVERVDSGYRSASGVQSSLVMYPIHAYGSEAQRQKYLPKLASGEWVGCFGLTEPNNGSDPGGMQTRARKVDGGFVLNGVKTLVPRAAEAELFIVAASLDGQPALFIVEAGAAGLTTEAEPAMGLRAASMARLQLGNVSVPATALLGAGAAEVYDECIALSRLAWCALAVGTSQAVLDYLIPYVNERVAFGEPISHRQAVAFAVSNVGIELEGMRLLTYRAASRAEQGQDYVRQVALARRLCADKGMAIGSDGVQLLGGHGFTKEYPVERWYRDLRAVGLMEGVLLV